MSIQLTDITSKLPTADTAIYRKHNQQLFRELNQTCIIIDDDPTGNQTVYDVPLLTKWDTDTITTEFLNETPALFLLTNSRSLSVPEVSKVFQEIIENILKAHALTKRKFSIISRSDSTLRGHFPLETDTITEFGNFHNVITAFIPVMFEGGRITANDIHYITDKKEAIPVGETPFAKDHTFGYTNSNLKDWIKEKTKGRVLASDIQSISLEAIRTKSTQTLCHQILNIDHNSYCIINALNYKDLDKITYSFLLAEKLGKKILYRTSSSFIPSYLGQPPKNLIDPRTLFDSDSENGGLVIVGSYVSKSSIQLAYLIEHWNIENSIEINIENVLGKEKDAYLSAIMEQVDQKLSLGNDIVIYTSRTVVTGEDAAATISIASKISEALISIVQGLRTPPKYILTKGGITSHDIATKGLSMKRSIVLGQLIPGVPAWKMGAETKNPGLPYIVFPGNVGDEEALFTITQKLSL